MSMFGNFKELRREIKDLREMHLALAGRVSQLEAEVAPFRIGPDPYAVSGYEALMRGYPATDPRPKVSFRLAIDLLREHLKLRWAHVDTVPARIELEKDK